MKTLLLSTACAAALGLAAAAHAEDAAVEELVVTANRYPQRAETVGQSVTVLDEAEIVASQAVALSDLLARTPGVGVTRNGGPGGVTAIRIRGAESDQTVVVVDGVKLNDPSTPGGGYNAANLLIGDVSRIEVLRGAQSTLWGSQAIGGVVNIATREPTEPFEALVQAEAGSMQTTYLRGALGGAGERFSWRASAHRYETEGVSAFRAGIEADGYETTAVSGRGRLQVTDALSLDLRGLYSKSRNDFDGFPPPFFAFADTAEYGETEEFSGYAGAELETGPVSHRLAFGYTRTDRDLFNPAQAATTRTFDSRGINKRWEYQGVWTISPDWTTTFGAEREEASMRAAAPSAFDPDPVADRAEAVIDGLYLQVQGEVVPGLSLTAGVRRDEHDVFGEQLLGQVAAAWTPNDGDTVLRASFGQGFKAPTLYQLFSEFGNPELQPEEAEGWDAGIEQALFAGRVTLAATWFRRETENQIDFFSCFGGSSSLCVVDGVPRFGFYDNIARTRAEGVELAGRADLGSLSIDANYTWTEAENLAGFNRGKQLPLRPEHLANLSATYRWESGVGITGAVRHVGESFANAGNTARLQSYTLVDLRAVWPVTDAVEFYGRIENVLDESYETSRNFGAPGRAGHVGVRARF